MTVKERLRKHHKVVLRPQLTSVHVPSNHQTNVVLQCAIPMARLMCEIHALFGRIDAVQCRIRICAKARHTARRRTPIVDAGQPKKCAIVIAANRNASIAQRRNSKRLNVSRPIGHIA